MQTVEVHTYSDLHRCVQRRRFPVGTRERPKVISIGAGLEFEREFQQGQNAQQVEDQAQARRRLVLLNARIAEHKLAAYEAAAEEKKDQAIMENPASFVPRDANNTEDANATAVVLNDASNTEDDGDD